jgi:hypothetical protein
MSSPMVEELSITTEEFMKDSTLKEKNMEMVNLLGMMTHLMKVDS